MSQRGARGVRGGRGGKERRGNGEEKAKDDLRRCTLERKHLRNERIGKEHD